MGIADAIDVGFGHTKYTLSRIDRGNIKTDTFPSMVEHATGASRLRANWLRRLAHLSQLLENGRDFSTGVVSPSGNDAPSPRPLPALSTTRAETNSSGLGSDFDRY
jgi:hypothetical protein